MSGGQAGLGGEGGGFTYDDELCDCILDGDGMATCTITEPGFEDNVEVPASCSDYVNEVERLECDDGTVRYQWIEGFDQGYRVVLDAASDALIYGRAAPYQSLCSVGERLEDVSYGTPPSASDL